MHTHIVPHLCVYMHCAFTMLLYATCTCTSVMMMTLLGRNTIRVDLIPLGVSFNGKMTVLKVPITIPIFSWQADTIYGASYFNNFAFVVFTLAKVGNFTCTCMLMTHECERH